MEDLAAARWPSASSQAPRSPAESAALLSATFLAPAGNCATRLLRSESARLEKDHEAAVAFGGTASNWPSAPRIPPTAPPRSPTSSRRPAPARSWRSRTARSTRCCAAWRWRVRRRARLQACRGLGNLTFGWGVDAIKEAIGGAARRRSWPPAASATLFGGRARRLILRCARGHAGRLGRGGRAGGAAGGPAGARRDAAGAGGELQGARGCVARPRRQPCGRRRCRRAGGGGGGARAHAADVAVSRPRSRCCAARWDRRRRGRPRRAVRRAHGRHRRADDPLRVAGRGRARELRAVAARRLTRAISGAAVGRRAAVAAELEGAGVRALFASEATKRRRKVRSEVDACLALLGDAPAEARLARSQPEPRRGGRAHRVRRGVPGHHRRGGVALRFVGRRGGLLVRRVARGVRRGAARSLRQKTGGLRREAAAPAPLRARARPPAALRARRSGARVRPRAPAQKGGGGAARAAGGDGPTPPRHDPAAERADRPAEAALRGGRRRAAGDRCRRRAPEAEACGT